MEILALIASKSSSILITTHSPYILGALNNLIYAGSLSEKPGMSEAVDAIIQKIYYVKGHNAYFLKDGTMQSCLESADDGGPIINEVIDGASSTTNSLHSNTVVKDRKYDLDSV